MPGQRLTGPVFLAVMALAVVACSGSELDSDSSAGEPSGSVTIESHQDGDTVSTSSIQLQGTAPPNAEIVQDISFAPDVRTSADAEGNWVLTVDLEEGANDVTLRIGEDESTSKRIRITYEPGAAAATDDPESATQSEAPTPEPTQEFLTFGEGDLLVGTDVQAGTYRTRTVGTLCYWERLSGFGGSLEEIIANGTGSGYFTIRIAMTDAGFNSSGCGEWSTDLSAVTDDPAGPITEDGVYIVGTDLAPGTWRSEGGSEFGCYAARLSGFGGTLNEIISNDLASEGGLIITIAASDVGFETTGCGTWTKVD